MAGIIPRASEISKDFETKSLDNYRHLIANSIKNAIYTPVIITFESQFSEKYGELLKKELQDLGYTAYYQHEKPVGLLGGGDRVIYSQRTIIISFST